MNRSIMNVAEGKQMLSDTFIFNGLGIDLQEYKPRWEYVFQPKEE